MKTLRIGSRGIETRYAQILFNYAIGDDLSYHALTADGVFGDETQTQIRHFQRHHQLVADGIIGPRTWAALGLHVDVEQEIRLVPQHTDMSCWSACAAMALRRQASIGSGGASLEVFAPGFGGLRPQLPNIERFAASIGYRVISPTAT